MSKKKAIIVIEKGKDGGYSVYPSDDIKSVIIGDGATVEEAKAEQKADEEAEAKKRAEEQAAREAEEAANEEAEESSEEKADEE